MLPIPTSMMHYDPGHSSGVSVGIIPILSSIMPISPHRNTPHSSHWYVLGPWSLQSWDYQGLFLKMGWSLSWRDCWKLGLF